MTSRERVRKAINHEKPDRVPVDIGGTIVTGIHIDEYVNLIRSTGFDLEPAKVYEQFQMLARVDQAMMPWLHADVIQLEHPSGNWGLVNDEWKIWTTNQNNRVLMPGGFNPIRDEQGCLHLLDDAGRSIARMPPSGLYFDGDRSTKMSPTEYPFIDPEVWKKSIPLYTDAELTVLEKRAKYLYEYTDYSVHGACKGGGLGGGGLGSGGHTFCDWLCILASDEDYAYAILQASTERALENLELYLQAAGKYIDTILISGTDFGTQNGELFNPLIFKKLYLPNYKLINDYVHGHSSVKTMFHSCGSIRNIIGYMIESGADILNPVQTNTSHMEPDKLKQEFGDKIVFWGGGVETQTVLPNGTPKDVKNQVRERIRIFGLGGGFVFTPIHNIQFGVPVENIKAMIEAVLEYGSY